MSECVWLLLPSFWKKDELMDWENELVTTVTSMKMDLHVIQGKGQVPCFPYSPTFHEDWFGLKRKIVTVWRQNSLYNKELNYKQLWCAPLQRDAVWESLCLTSQMWNNATVEVQSEQCDHSLKLTEWHNSALWFVSFSQKPYSVCMTRGRRRGREGTTERIQISDYQQ